MDLRRFFNKLYIVYNNTEYLVFLHTVGVVLEVSRQMVVIKKAVVVDITDDADNVQYLTTH